MKENIRLILADGCLRDFAGVRDKPRPGVDPSEPTPVLAVKIDEEICDRSQICHNAVLASGQGLLNRLEMNHRESWMQRQAIEFDDHFRERLLVASPIKTGHDAWCIDLSGFTSQVLTREDDDILPLLRHSCAHVLAEAVQSLYPGTKVAIGPPIEDGFYYDFDRPQTFTSCDLGRIEKKMHQIIGDNAPFERETWERQQAVDYFRDRGEHYKVEIIENLPLSASVWIYRQGRWLDLCRGPHLPSTGWIGQAFKLTKVAGAYFRGDHRRPMLQRIYGTAWRTKDELQSYLDRIEQAQLRDHRKLGREMELFHFQEEAAGSAFWHPRGYILWRIIEDHLRIRLATAGYQEVKTPQLVDRSLWEASGHWDKFREHMFAFESQGQTLALKPMNCPCHVQIYRQGVKSYRDLPLRMAEFGSCHRNEPSGSIHGLMRARAFTQDDAHIFCTPDQITSETVDFCRLLEGVYRDFGFTQSPIVKFATRPDVRAGDDTVWDRAEKALEEAVTAAGLEFVHNPGQGAFYGPKLEFVLRDAIGRSWQCGTLQVDFVLPERLGAYYTDRNGLRYHPVMLHRAILGSLERFTGILIEHHAGWLPLWLAPVQVAVATVTDESAEHATQVGLALQQVGVRAWMDLRNEKIGYKIRELTAQKIPLILVVGKQEATQGSVTIRRAHTRSSARPSSSAGGDSTRVQRGQTRSVALEQAIAEIRSMIQPPAAPSNAGQFSLFPQA